MMVKKMDTVWEDTCSQLVKYLDAISLICFMKIRCQVGKDIPKLQK